MPSLGQHSLGTAILAATLRDIEPYHILLNQKIEQLKMSEQDACKMVGADSFEELQGGPKGNASELIGLLIKKSGGSTRRRRRRKK